MEVTKLLKAIADETRYRILTLLLEHNYCVRALSRKLDLSEPAISQHLKVLREAGLIVGEKRGYFMHYDVDREKLAQLSLEIEKLSSIERKICRPENVGCKNSERKRCHAHKANNLCHKEEGLANEGEYERK